MNPAVRAELMRIDDFFASRLGVDSTPKQRDEARQLWDVLTALRGPDNGDDTLKLKTTCVIRTAAFPKTAAARIRGLAIFVDTTEPYYYESPYAAEGMLHFLQHANSAAQRLDLLP